MNRFINNWGVGISMLLLCACTGTQEPQTPAITEDASQKIVSQAQPVAPAVKPADATPAVTQLAQTTKVELPQKEQVAERSSVERFKAWDKNLHFLKTDFTQITTYDGVVVSRSQGTLFYDQAKNALRLDTQDTDGTLIQSAVTDKKIIFILDEKGKEVSQLSWQEWQQGQPNQALFDFGNYTELLSRHNVKVIRPYSLELTPKEGEGYTLYLTLQPKDCFPQSIKLVSGNLVTQADLTNIQQNKPLPQATFGGFFK